MAKTSLQKSHSKSSNLALTLLCLLVATCFVSLFCVLAYFEKLSSPLNILLPVAIGGVALMSLSLLLLFHR